MTPGRKSCDLDWMRKVRLFTFLETESPAQDEVRKQSQPSTSETVEATTAGEVQEEEDDARLVMPIAARNDQQLASFLTTQPTT